MASAVPEHLRLLRKAQNDLEKIPREERARVIEDLTRLAARTFPGEVKKIRSLRGQPLQADSGRFRILHLWEGRVLWILAIFARSRQSAVFRSRSR